nr:DUF3800 domain-containing protein [Nocardioides panaciterrulae]
MLRVYIDETGDRGVGPKASPFFAFSAVLVADEDEAHLMQAVRDLRQDFGIPAGKALHWNEHVKTFPRRQRVASLLGALTPAMVVHVAVEKAGIPQQAGMRNDHALFYNFAAGMVMERVLLAARDWPGGTRDALVRFGHVRGFKHDTTADYIDHRRRSNNPHWVPWHLMHSLHFDGQANYLGLQAADQYAGMLALAFRPDEFGGFEEHHFLRTAHQIRAVNGRRVNYGFKWLGRPATLAAIPWWRQAAWR